MSPELDTNYWNQRYLNNEFGWDIGEISTPLKNYFDQLTDKDCFILIPGAGNAYEAEYLVNKGFSNVYVCDFSEQPLLNLKERCSSIPSSHLLQEDYFKLPFKNKFDLIVEQTFFCALLPELRQNYFLKTKELLKPGGKLVGLLFNDTLNSDKPPFGGTSNEYYNYFKDDYKINVFEPCYNSIKPRQGRELFINLQKL
ncbi:MAG: hypothetical protein JWO32_1733 [Bacteroidetes bacterium]|nr:hypothetical protein [Bacteroidota bacterium]